MDTTAQSALNLQFAEAYKEAVLAGADMRAASNALETLRETLTAGISTVAAMAVLDEQIGRADAERLMPVLVKLREPYEEKLAAREVARLKLVAEKDSAKAWNSWVKSYVACLSDRGWYTELGWTLAKEALTEAPGGDWTLERIRDAAMCVAYERWGEAYDWFLFLASQELPAAQRAGLLVSASEVQLFYFQQTTKARNLLKQALEMAPEKIRVWNGWGEYLLQLLKLDEAREYFERILRKAPDLADGFVGLGDCFDKSGKPDAAEDQYQQAIVNCPGSSAGYERLIDFYGRPSSYKDSGSRIQPLFQRLQALSSSEAGPLTRLGILYKQNREFDKARECFQKAIASDDADTNSRAWLAYTCLDQNDYAAAEPLLRQVIQMAPHAIDGYWALSALHIQKQEWQAAVDACDQTLKNCHPEWECLVRIRRASVLQAMDRLNDAVKDVLRALELEPEGAAALDIVSSLVNTLMKSDREAALNLLVETRKRVGDSYEVTFENLTGNTWYYHSDYAKAADGYRKAAAAGPGDHVVHSNLALALENGRGLGNRMAQVEEAISHLKLALQLSPQTEEYAKRLAVLETEHAFLTACGENAALLEMGVSPIRVNSSGELLQLIMDASGTALSEVAMAKTEAMRKRVQARYGVILPGINYGVLSQTADGRAYEILFLETDVVPGFVNGHEFVHQLPDGGNSGKFQPRGTWISDGENKPDGGDYELWMPLDWLMNHVEHESESRLSQFIGHQELAALLDGYQSESVKKVRETPEKLSLFVQVIRGILSRHVPVVEMDYITAEFLQLSDARTPLPEMVARLCESISAKSMQVKATAQ